MSAGLDGGVQWTTNSYVCRSCKTLCHGRFKGILDGVPVCPRCREAYNRERGAAEAAVDQRWLAKLHREDD